MNAISFGNLTVMVKNQKQLATALHKQLFNQGVAIKSEDYHDSIHFTDGRPFSDRNANTITELRIKTKDPAQEKSLLQQLHDWALKNKVNTRVDIDIHDKSIRRAQLVSHYNNGYDDGSC